MQRQTSSRTNARLLLRKLLLRWPTSLDCRQRIRWRLQDQSTWTIYKSKILMLRAQWVGAGSPSLCNQTEPSPRRAGQKEAQSLTRRTPLRDQNRCSLNQRRKSTRKMIDGYRSSRHKRLSVQELLQSSTLRILRSTSQCLSRLWPMVSFKMTQYRFRAEAMGGQVRTEALFWWWSQRWVPRRQRDTDKLEWLQLSGELFARYEARTV